MSTSETLGKGSTQMSPISFYVKLGDRVEPVDFYYNSYVADVLKKAGEIFGISETDMIGYRLVTEDGPLFKVSRLYDCDSIKHGCVCELQEK